MTDADTDPTVTVVGSYNHDLSMSVPSLPSPGETVLGDDFAEGVGGKGSNQAIGAARLGAVTSFVGCVGDDRFGDRAAALWAEEGVVADYVRQAPETHTGVAFIVVDADGENAISVASGANSRLSPADVRAAADTVRAADVLLCQLETEIEPVVEAAKIAADAGTEVVLNPAPARELPDALLDCVDVLTPNRAEAHTLTGRAPTDAVDPAALLDSLSAFGVDRTVVTLGPDGAIVDARGTRTRIDAIDVDIVDTTGAGDAFNAGVAVGRAEGLSIVEATRFGCACGGLSCTAAGVVPSLPDRDAVDAVRTR